MVREPVEMGRLRETESTGQPAQSPPAEDQHLTDEVAVDQPRIVATPGICGGSARVYGTRIPVWGLEVGRRVGRSDKNLLRAYPSLTAADLQAAWRYVDAHREQIEAEIRENDGP
jgi:type III restriction enzyme